MIPDQLLIRPFLPGDQEEARKLILESFGERFGFINEALNSDLDDIMVSYIHPGHLFLVASYNHILIGTGALLFEDQETGTIVRVSTHSNYRRKGIANAIVRCLIAQAREKHYRYLQLSTNKDWLDAIALYQQCGFSIVWSNEKGVKMLLDLSLTS